MARASAALALSLLLAPTAEAGSLIALRTIPARDLITEADLGFAAESLPGALDRVEDAAGQEARVTIYAGRPVRESDIGRPAIVERNQVVTISFRAGALTIVADGRVLDRAGVGERVRVMNLESRNIVTGEVHEDGSVEVGR